MNLGHSELNPSSLIDLKAELTKKYDLFKKAKLVQNQHVSKRTPFKNKSEDIVQKKKIIKLVTPKEENSEEDLALEKSRLALEAKAKLYENITSNNILIDDEENDRYLVDFQRKVVYGSTDSEKTKEVTPSSSNNVQVNTNAFSQSSLKNSSFGFQIDTSKSDFQMSGEKDSGEHIHYENIRYNEVRDHGTAYFAFSTDEAKRKEQMEELSSLRQETEDQRLSKQRLQRKRKALLQTRLAKVCERRNINQNVIEAYTSNTEIPDLPQSETVDLSSIPLPETKDETEKKPKVRPWDVGKDNLHLHVPEKRKIKSQSEWVEERRSERLGEFAPPSSYF